MKITMYELLGMVKDGKAPKKIKYKDFIYEYYEQETVIDYRTYDEKNGLYGYLSSCIDYETFNILDNEVEILEEEKKIPEELPTWFSLEKDCENDNIQYANYNFERMYGKINEICDYLKSKGDE